MTYKNNLKTIFRDRQIDRVQIVGYLSGLSKITTMRMIAKPSFWIVQVSIDTSHDDLYPFTLETSLPPERVIYSLDPFDGSLRGYLIIRLERDNGALLATISFSEVRAIHTVDWGGRCKSWTLEEFFTDHSTLEGGNYENQ